jgi:hypothetical protein
MSVMNSGEMESHGWTLSMPEFAVVQEPLVVVAGIHGKEDAALEIAKVGLRVPNVVPMLASIRSILAEQRWVRDGPEARRDRNMSGQIPGNRHSPLYNGQRAWMLDQRLGELPHSDILEFHSSIDGRDFGWVFAEPPQAVLKLSTHGAIWDKRQSYTDHTNDTTVLKMLRLGVRDFVVADRRFNLFGHYMNAGVIDIGTQSIWRDRRQTEDLLFWMENEYDPALDPLGDTACFARGDPIPEVRFYSHAGWVPHKERKRVDLPDDMETLEPIDPEKADALGLPPGSMAVSWKAGLPMAGEVFVPYSGHLPGLLGRLATANSV